MGRIFKEVEYRQRGNSVMLSLGMGMVGVRKTEHRQFFDPWSFLFLQDNQDKAGCTGA